MKTTLRIFQTQAHGRLPRHDPFWHGKKTKFAIIVTVVIILLQLLFLGNLSLLFGAAWKDVEHTHNIVILFVDYDQGVIGQSILTAYDSLAADHFPTLQQHNVTEYPTSHDVYQAVRDGHYWAAMYVNIGASNNLNLALSGGLASTYKAEDAVAFVWNEARYPTIGEGDVLSSVQTIMAVAPVVYGQMLAASNQATLTSASIPILTRPFGLTEINIMPTAFGTRVFLNTVSIVFSMIQQFFFLMSINGISTSFEFYERMPVLDNGFMRLGLSILFTFCGSLVSTSIIWIFKDGWSVNGSQFMLTWMLYWLFAHINFCVFDIATAVIPIAFLTFFVLTWIVLNVTSSVLPVDVLPGFYRVMYAMPANNHFGVLITIWSKGGNNRLHRNLPVLFAWEVVALLAAIFAMHYRCHKAWKNSVYYTSGKELAALSDEPGTTESEPTIQLFKSA